MLSLQQTPGSIIGSVNNIASFVGTSGHQDRFSSQSLASINVHLHITHNKGTIKVNVELLRCLLEKSSLWLSAIATLVGMMMAIVNNI